MGYGEAGASGDAMDSCSDGLRCPGILTVCSIAWFGIPQLAGLIGVDQLDSQHNYLVTHHFT